MAALFSSPKTNTKTPEEQRQEEERRRRSLLAQSSGGTLLTSPTGLEVPGPRTQGYL